MADRSREYEPKHGLNTLRERINSIKDVRFLAPRSKQHQQSDEYCLKLVFQHLDFSMGLSQLATYGILTAAAVAAVQPTNGYATHERRDIGKRDTWVKRNRVSARDVLPMRIGLTQRNLEHGAELLRDVSDPNSANYGKHWTREQVAKMFEPSKETVATVKKWLDSTGITADRIQHSRGNGWLTFNASAAEAEKLFQTEYYTYDHSIESRSAVGCDEYVLFARCIQLVRYYL